MCSQKNRLIEAILMSTHNIPFSIQERKSPLIIPNLQLWDFSKGLKHDFETTVVYEPSVFESLKFYCNLQSFMQRLQTIFQSLPS